LLKKVADITHWHSTLDMFNKEMASNKDL